MPLHEKLLALSLVASVLLPLMLVPVAPDLADIQPVAQSAPQQQADSDNCTDCGARAQRP